MARLDASYSVGGIAYARPFKIRRLGHFGFNPNDAGKAKGVEIRRAGLSPRTGPKC